jgi:hypothetical protein
MHKIRLNDKLFQAVNDLIKLIKIIYSYLCIYFDVAKKSSPATRHGGAWRERRYIFYSFLTSALDGVSGQRHDPAAFAPGKGTPVPIVQEAGWAPILCLCRSSNLDLPVVQYVIRHYTD